MKGARLSWAAGLGLLGLVLGLYLVKNEATATGEAVEALRAQVAEDRQAIAMLRAELAFLEDPRRIEAAAAGALGLAPIATDKRITLAELPAALDAMSPPAAAPAPSLAPATALGQAPPEETATP
jgi:hypothetical protein